MSDPAPSRGGAGGYAAFVQLTREIRTAHESGANLAAMAMVYVGIDTMALLACPLGKTEQSKEDFIRGLIHISACSPPRTINTREPTFMPLGAPYCTAMAASPRITEGPPRPECSHTQATDRT